jgi:GNAT superfamily N-acetyltransferase
VQEAAFQIEDRTYKGGWIVDVMILPSHRGLGLGHSLHEDIPARIPLVVTLTMAPATRRIAEKAGCITLGDVRQFSKWVWLDADAVRRYLETKTVRHAWVRPWVEVFCRLQLHRIFPRLTNPVIVMRDALRRDLSQSARTEVREVDRFESDIDELWHRLRHQYAVIVPRTSQFLNWRFVDCPTRTYRRFVARRDGRTLGYVVLRRREPVELPEGVIVDIFAARDDQETIRDLVAHSLHFFGRSVAVVDCAASVPEFEAVLKRFGFFVTRRHQPTCVTLDPDLRARLQALKSECFFSKADHDWDQIHRA